VIDVTDGQAVPPPQVEVEVNFACGLQETPQGTEVVIGFMIGGKFQSTLTLTADAADRIGHEIIKAAKAASTPIATPTNHIIIPGR
jgi:hypothetical protein